jgi:hypothetical protein
MLRKWVLFGGLAVGSAALVGCRDSSVSVELPPAAKPAEDHGHKPGTHGGTIVPVGRDGYHAEAVFANNGVVRLYTLGRDESRVLEVDVQELVGFATAVGSTDAAVEVKFAAEPQPGDAAGKTSAFVGKLPAELAGKPVRVTVNNLRIGAERFRVAFTNEQAVHDAGGMPEGVGTEEARKLYLAPGGKYTEADVKANGSTIPTAKYKGIKASHDAKPQPGDKICPISMTKANPKFTWVVGGKTYEFCCVPCVDEFVQTAKDKPDQIKEPGDYVKK